MNLNTIPHLRVVVAVSGFILLCFALVTAYVIIVGNDEVTKGNIIGTWQNFALLVVGFWIGSSSGGKSRGSVHEEPQPVTVKNTPGEPIVTTDV